ncbi:uncharacterized protein BDV14DRAFT_198859 [Aspergillus stella-maris]|uniref:uncharacterized protein n=1 Tax=Aspergillus stella-maris TaxID=1810926 RepID=UPI003CCCB6B8
MPHLDGTCESVLLMVLYGNGGAGLGATATVKAAREKREKIISLLKCILAGHTGITTASPPLWTNRPEDDPAAFLPGDYFNAMPPEWMDGKEDEDSEHKIPASAVTDPYPPNRGLRAPDRGHAPDGTQNGVVRQEHLRREPEAKWRTTVTAMVERYAPDRLVYQSEVVESAPLISVIGDEARIIQAHFNGWDVVFRVSALVCPACVADEDGPMGDTSAFPAVAPMPMPMTMAVKRTAGEAGLDEEEEDDRATVESDGDMGPVETWLEKQDASWQEYGCGICESPVRRLCRHGCDCPLRESSWGGE